MTRFVAVDCTPKDGRLDGLSVVQIVVPWVLSIAGICVTIYVSYIARQTQRMLSSNEKAVQQIDLRLKHLREDLVRFYSAFTTNPKESLANIIVAYEILLANPLVTDDLRAAAYKMREFTTIEVMGRCGTPVKPDSGIKLGDTYQASMDELGKSYRRIVEEQNRKREEYLLSGKNKRRPFKKPESLLR